MMNLNIYKLNKSNAKKIPKLNKKLGDLYIKVRNYKVLSTSVNLISSSSSSSRIGLYISGITGT